MKSFLLCAAAAVLLSACYREPEPAPLPDLAAAEAPTSTPRNFEAERRAYDETVHRIIAAAPEDYRTRPCVYVAGFNVGGTYDIEGRHFDGASRDYAVFAELGRFTRPAVGTEPAYEVVEVAARNLRKDPVESDLARSEPDVVRMYFRASSMTRDVNETAWVQSGLEPTPGDCRA